MAAKCNVACKVDYEYTPSGAFTSGSNAIFKYRVKNPSDPSAPYTEFTKSPPPLSGDEVNIEGIQSDDEYELMLTLNINGATAQKSLDFKVDRCCKEPSISKVYLEQNNQIVMDYSVGLANFYAIQYQIATDSSFNHIIHVRVVMQEEYTATEYIEMNGGTIPDNTKLFIRARNYCSSSEISSWSNVVAFTSGQWVSLYPFDAYCVSGKYNGRDPRYIDETGICQSAKSPFQRKVYLTTPNPQAGTYLYSGYNTPARPAVKGDLSDFDDQNGGVGSGFNESGILWIRFEKEGLDSALIYNVDPDKGQILNVSLRFKCES